MPLLANDTKQLSAIFKDTVQHVTYTQHPRVISFTKKGDDSEIIFFTHPKHVMHIYKADIGMQSGLRPIPGLVWRYSISSYPKLDMWAYKKYAGFDTKLFVAPFMNVTGQSVCLGSTERYVDGDGSLVVNAAVDHIEKAFWASSFSHSTSGVQVKGNLHAELTRQMFMKSYPYEILLPSYVRSRQQLRIRNLTT